MSEPTSSRRTAMQALLALAAGSAAVAVVTGGPDDAAAASGVMQFGASNNAGGDVTTLVSTNINGRALSVQNAAGFAYGGEAETLYGGFATNYGVNLTAGAVGGRFEAPTVGVIGVATNGFGVFADGVLAPLYLTPRGVSPLRRTEAHNHGEVVADTSGGLWYCIGSGTPGTWRQLAGNDTAGALHPVEPTRVFDSRWPGFGGRLASGSSTPIQVEVGRNLDGSVANTGLVPTGATALCFTITVADTQAGGFLAVTAHNASAYRASAINWTSSGQVLANSTLVKLASFPEIRVWCDGGGSTHVLIDVLGYYL